MEQMVGVPLGDSLIGTLVLLEWASEGRLCVGWWQPIKLAPEVTWWRGSGCQTSCPLLGMDGAWCH